MNTWHKTLCAASIGAALTIQNAAAQAVISVATSPDVVGELFSAVSSNPRFRIGSYYAGGEAGIASFQIDTAFSPAPSQLVASLPRVNHLATFGGGGVRNVVFATAGTPFRNLYAYDPATVGMPGTTTMLTRGDNVFITQMLANKRERLAVILDEGPTKLRGTQLGPAEIVVYSANTLESVGGFKMRGAISDPPGCPCLIAADPNDFYQIYAISIFSDTLTAHRDRFGRLGSATGSITVSNPINVAEGLVEIVADQQRAYVKDRAGRLHTVTPVGDAPTFRGETLSLVTALTDLTIVGELVRDTQIGSSYYFDLGNDVTSNASQPSAIKVYAALALQATIPTAGNKIRRLIFGAADIFFQDGLEETAPIKAINRATFQVRTIPTGNATGFPLHYDAFNNVLLLESVVNGLVNGIVLVPVGAPSAAGLASVVSRKSHGAAGTFDLAVNQLAPVNGAVTVEPRSVGTGHSIVFQFDAPVLSVASVTARDASANPVGAAAFAINANEVIVTLTGVPDNQRVEIALASINGSAANVAASVGFLVGDVNSSRGVNSSDISAVKARSGQPVDSGNFKFDLNASGAINSSDISLVKARSGAQLAP